MVWNGHWAVCYLLLGSMSMMAWQGKPTYDSHFTDERLSLGFWPTHRSPVNKSYTWEVTSLLWQYPPPPIRACELLALCHGLINVPDPWLTFSKWSTLHLRRLSVPTLLMLFTHGCWDEEFHLQEGSQSLGIESSLFSGEGCVQRSPSTILGWKIQIWGYKFWQLNSILAQEELSKKVSMFGKQESALICSLRSSFLQLRLFLLVMTRASSYKLFGISLSLIPIHDSNLGVLFFLTSQSLVRLPSL